MSTGHPSFYRLFRRSRSYGGFRPEFDGDDADEGDLKKKEERERFAAAAIAFCLKHDEIFRRHFWEKICRVPEDPEECPRFESKDIGLEPPVWADLSLTFQDKDVRYRWVVEIKAGAELKAKQNPTSSEFKIPGIGYGSLFSEHEKAHGTRMRYTVLGADEEFALSDGTVKAGISVQRRDWTQLLADLPQTSLSDDLVNSLGELQIASFIMEQAKGIVIPEGGLSNVGKAWKVLEGVCKWLEVPDRKRTFEAYTDDEGSDVLGVYINPTGNQSKASSKHKALAKRAGNRGSLAWFGYTNTAGKIKRSVYFYCGSQSQRDSLAAALAKTFIRPEPGRDGDEYFVFVESPPEDEKTDDLSR